MNNDKFNEIKNIEVFPGKKLTDLFETVFNNSIEVKNEALSAYREFKSMIKGDDDLFLNGEKLDPFLKTAQNASDDIVKLVGAVQKLISETNKEDGDGQFDSGALIDVLEQQNIGPSRFVRNEEKIINESNKKFIAFKEA